MAELVTSRRAEEELRQIWRYIAAENPAAADRFLLRLNEKLQLLRDFPGLGTLRDDICPGLRMLVEGNYLLLYEHDPAENVVELISAIDGRSDLSALFRSGGRVEAPPSRRLSNQTCAPPGGLMRTAFAATTERPQRRVATRATAT